MVYEASTECPGADEFILRWAAAHRPAIAASVVAFIVSALAGMFGGKASFAHGLATTSLAFVPGHLGQALNWLPDTRIENGAEELEECWNAVA